MEGGGQTLCQFAQSLATRGFSALASWMEGRRVMLIMEGGQEGGADHGWRVVLIMDGGWC